MMKNAATFVLVLFVFGSSTSSGQPLAETADNVALRSSVNSIAPEEALEHYVGRPDASFEWNLERTTKTEAGVLYELRITSQTWQDISWRHAVEIYEPKELRFPNHAILYVTGGSKPSPPGPGDIVLGMRLSSLAGARVVMLHQTPNQPLLGNRKEDDLISETWLRYLETGNSTWPLLFPMVKSAVRTMDAVEAFSEQRWGQSIDRFVITGASKRGWTSWLTPVVDDRVVGTAPIVIDVLNFRAQMNHQLATWGKFSQQINDYTRKGLVKGPNDIETPREKALRTMMDPYTYREQLKLPKCLIVGTNDPYWVVDAMNLYWDDLKGPKVIRQIPNAGHGLEGGRENAIATLAAFFRHVAEEEPLPDFSWAFEADDSQLTLSMKSVPKPKSVRFWTARSSDMDFRDAKWTSSTLSESEGQWVGTAKRETNGYVAVFGEFEYETDGYPWSLTTLVFRR